MGSGPAWLASRHPLPGEAALATWNCFLTHRRPSPSLCLSRVFWKEGGTWGSKSDLSLPPYLGLAKTDLPWRGRLRGSEHDNRSSICSGQTLPGPLGTPLPLAAQSCTPPLPPAQPNRPSAGALHLSHLPPACRAAPDPAPPPSTALVPTFLPNPQSSSQSWFQNPSQRLSFLWSQRSEGLPFSLGIELTAPHTSPSYSPQLYVSHSALLLDVPQHPELIPAPGPLHWLLPLPGSFFPQMAVSFPPSLPSVLPKRYPTREGFPVPSFLRHDHSIQPPPHKASGSSHALLGAFIYYIVRLFLCSLSPSSPFTHMRVTPGEWDGLMSCCILELPTLPGAQSPLSNPP